MTAHAWLPSIIVCDSIMPGDREDIESDVPNTPMTKRKAARAALGVVPIYEGLAKPARHA